MKTEKLVNSNYILKENYYAFNNLETINAFFIKPYDFNINIVGENKLNQQYQLIKDKLKLDSIATVTQKHTSIIKIVTKDNIDDVDIADGLITNELGIALATKVADCQAIFLYDSIKKAIGNVHSGWKGTVQKIVGNAITLMVKEYGCNVKDIQVYINPSINKCHFEVDQDVYEQFKDSFKEIDIDKFIEYNKNKNKYYIDTIGINISYLEYLGLDKKNIYSSNICTVCNGNTIHSYRYDKDKSGRNLAIISL